jgi:hypothetical protein
MVGLLSPSFVVRESSWEICVASTTVSDVSVVEAVVGLSSCPI